MREVDQPRQHVVQHAYHGKPVFPEVNQDPLLAPGYMGDYDTVASEFLGTKPGFFGAWGDNTKGNPDVTGSKF